MHASDAGTSPSGVITGTVQPLLRATYGRSMGSVSFSMLGLGGLFDVMAAQGVPRDAILAGTGLTPAEVDKASTRMTQSQKIRLFRNVLENTDDSAVGLRAGQRQRLSDFGVYGFALSSSATFGDAVSFGIRHLKLVGPSHEKTFRIDNGVAIFEGHELFPLGDLMPMVTEFWFSSIYTLISRVMEHPFKTDRLLLPYPEPKHAAVYAEVFNCEVEFGAGVMQWHFNPALLAEPCPNANAITAEMCGQFCARMLQSLTEDEPEIVRTIRASCLAAVGGLPTLEQMADKLNVSARTLHRRLVGAGVGYQQIIDDVRRRLAEEFLTSTDLSIDEVADRIGFSDASNFRKAFKKWVGKSPSEYRQGRTARPAF